MKYQLTLNKGIAGRIRPDDIIEDFENPKYGFYWWLWVPNYHLNRGIMKSQEVVDVNITWLCFWVGFTLWPNSRY